MPIIGNGSGNSNNFRKIGTFDRIKPVSIQVVQNNITRSFDGNHLVIHRDSYYIDQPFVLVATTAASSGSYPFGEYAENTVSFAGETTKTVTFASPFSSTPIIVLSIESSNQENIIAFVSASSTTGFDIQLSAPLNGYVITYRAIYSTTYPAIVQRSPLNPTMYYTASAGQYVASNASSFTASFDSLGSVPTNVFATNQDTNGNGGANVGYVYGVGYDSTTVNADFSATTNLTVNYIVTK